MALGYIRRVVQWLNADGVGTKYPLSSLGFVPKAVKAVCVGVQSATDVVVSNADGNRCKGFAVSDTERRCVASYTQDGAANANCGSIARDDCVLATVNGDGSAGGRLDIEFDTDEIRLVVDATTIAADLTVLVDIWGGDDIELAKVLDIAEPAATGSVDYAVTGFDDNTDGDQVVMFAGVQSSSALNTGEAIDSGFCSGFATGTGAQQSVVAGNSEDGAASMNTDRYGMSGEVLAMFAQDGSSSLNARVALTAFATDKVTVNWIERGVTGRRYIALAIKGGRWRAGEYTIDTTTVGNTATVSGLPFQPGGGLIMASQGAEDAADTPGTVDAMCFGSFKSTSDRGCLVYRDRPGSAACQTFIGVDYDALRIATGNSTTLNQAEDLDAITSDGFRTIMDVADATGATDFWVAYLTFASAPSGALAGTAGLNLAGAGTLLGAGALTGTAALAASCAGTLLGAGALAGESALAWSSSAALAGQGALAAGSDLIFAAAGELTGTGGDALAGTASFTWSLAGTLIGAGALAGAVPVSIELAGNLAGAGRLAGEASLSAAVAGSLAGAGALAGNAALAIDTIASASGEGELTGGAAMAASLTGVLGGLGELAANVELLFGAQAQAQAIGALAGEIQLAITATLEVGPSTAHEKRTIEIDLADRAIAVDIGSRTITVAGPSRTLN